MLKEYHIRVNQLLNVKQRLTDKITDADVKLSLEIDKVVVHFNSIVDQLLTSKNILIDELKSRMTYKKKKIQDKHIMVCQQIDRINSLMKNFHVLDKNNQKELYESGLLIEA